MPTKRDSEAAAVRASKSNYDCVIVRANGVSAATTIVVHPRNETPLRGPIEAARPEHRPPSCMGRQSRITARELGEALAG